MLGRKCMYLYLFSWQVCVVSWVLYCVMYLHRIVFRCIGTVANKDEAHIMSHWWRMCNDNEKMSGQRHFPGGRGSASCRYMVKRCTCTRTCGSNEMKILQSCSIRIINLFVLLNEEAEDSEIHRYHYRCYLVGLLMWHCHWTLLEWSLTWTRNILYGGPNPSYIGLH